MKNVNKIKIIDLFAGCGGLSDGFEQSMKYDIVAHIEWENVPCTTLIKRFCNKWKYRDIKQRVLRFDIQRTKELIFGWRKDPEYGSGEGLDRLVGNGGIDVIIGGPPCQAYSVAGRIRDEYGMHNDYRNYLFESYIKVVKHFKPKAIIFENVPGMLSAKPGGISIAERITKEFSKSGYEIVGNLQKNAIIDFSLFGVPQNRSRVIILGLNKRIFKKNRQDLLSKFYNNILVKYHVDKIKTVNEAISDLPAFKPSKSDYSIVGKRFSHEPNITEIYNHIPRYINRRDIQIFRQLALDIQTGENSYTSIDKLQELYTKKTGKTSNVHKYYVLRWNEPSNTIPAHLYKDGLRHIHPDPEQARSITAREAARLQTFDDDFEFTGSMGNQYKMIGNAVPPLFAKCLAHAVYDLLKEYFREV